MDSLGGTREAEKDHIDSLGGSIKMSRDGHRCEDVKMSRDVDVQM